MAKRLFQLWKLYARMDWYYTTQDLFTAIVTILSETILALSSFAGVALLAVQFGGAGGLSEHEILVMLSFHIFAKGLENMLFGNCNVGIISRRVGRAQVDHMLIQPMPLWMQLLTEGFMPISGSESMLCGVFALIAFVPMAGIAVTPLWMVLLFVLAFSRIAIRLALSYIAGSFAFWEPAGCEELSDVLLGLCDTVSDYPLSGMPRMVVGVLVTVIPLGVLTYLPGLILLGRLDALWTAWPVFLAVLLASAAAAFFRKGLKHYVKAGCARYKAMGHRS